MATWPITLSQCPLISSLSGEMKDGVLVSNVPMGQDKRRRLFTALTTVYNIGLVMTATQYKILEAFYLANMTTEFDLIDPIDLSAAAVVFASRPKLTGRRGKYWAVSFSIEVQL